MAKDSVGSPNIWTRTHCFQLMLISFLNLQIKNDNRLAIFPFFLCLSTKLNLLFKYTNKLLFKNNAIFSGLKVSSVNEERLTSPTSHASQLQKHFLVFIRVMSLCAHQNYTAQNQKHSSFVGAIFWCLESFLQNSFLFWWFRARVVEITNRVKGYNAPSYDLSVIVSMRKDVTFLYYLSQKGAVSLFILQIRWIVAMPQALYLTPVRNGCRLDCNCGCNKGWLWLQIYSR